MGEHKNNHKRLVRVGQGLFPFNLKPRLRGGGCIIEKLNTNRHLGTQGTQTSRNHGPSYSQEVVVRTVERTTTLIRVYIRKGDSRTRRGEIGRTGVTVESVSGVRV